MIGQLTLPYHPNGQKSVKVLEMFAKPWRQRLENADKRRLSSAVEQRFCKPKVGGSIPSAGTTRKLLYHKRFLEFLVAPDF